MPSKREKYQHVNNIPKMVGGLVALVLERITHSLAVASDNKHRRYNALKLGVPSGLGENALRAALSGPRNLHPRSMSPVVG